MKAYPRDDKKIKHYTLGNGKKLIVQPLNSPICGQCAMAMIAGVDAKVIINQLYSITGTNHLERDPILQKYMDDVRSENRVDNRKFIDMTGKGILAVQFGKSRTGHAVAFEDGQIYDPGGWFFESYAEMKEHYAKRGRKIRIHTITRARERVQRVELVAAGNSL